MTMESPKINPQELIFRPLKTSDLSLMNALMREGKGHWGYEREALDRFMASYGVDDASYFEDAFGFFVEDARGIIGYYSFKTEENPVLLDLFFLEKMRIGKGYGRFLWEHAISQARKRGWRDFIFWSDPNSQPFYERMGAIVIDHRWTIPGYQTPIMKYEIKLNKEESRSGKDE